MNTPSETEFAALDALYEVHNKDSDKKTYLCKFPDCARTFRFKSEIVRHCATHTAQRPFECDFDGCNKSFKRQDALENHKRIHTNENPYICEVEGCEKSFPTKSSLRYHVLKHKDEKNFVCSHPGCTKSFMTLFQLKQHERAANLHKKIKIASETNINKPERAFVKAVADGASPSTVSTSAEETHGSKPYKIGCTNESKTACPLTVVDKAVVNQAPNAMVDEKCHPLIKQNMELKKRLEFTEKLLMNVLQQQPSNKGSQMFVEKPGVSDLARLLLLQKLSSSNMNN